ncbi:unnamed protein product [Orchesella dallaii]|uniref:Uncharacterized protein n=1 Tax=Orchesella dallaii TaxID=48710 RepID=A0ABP1RCS0_9HEXA
MSLSSIRNNSKFRSFYVVTLDNKMFHQNILSKLTRIIFMLNSIIQSVESHQTLIFQRFNWLNDFGNCYNFILALEGVQYVPKINYHRIDKLVPYVNYRILNNSNVYRFNRWTTCQTLSVVMNLNNRTNTSKVSGELQMAFFKLGFQNATYCLPFGHFCSVALNVYETSWKPNYIHQRPLGMYPLQIFFIVPDTTATNRFTSLTFIQKFDPNPFFQTHYRVTFPVQERMEVSGSRVDGILMEESICTEITFMCKYCNTSNSSYTKTQYPFTDIKSTCDSTDLQNIMLNLYFNATGNGKKFKYNYYKYVDFQNLEIQIDKENFRIVRNIHNAETIFEILRTRPRPTITIDDVIASILFDGLDVLKNFTGNSYFGDKSSLAIGTNANLNLGFGILKMSSKSFNFITCDSKKSIDFFVILRSFQAIVWYLLVLVILLTPLIMHVSINLNCWQNKVTITDTISPSSVVLCIIALLLGTVVYTKELNQNCKLRGVFATWLLTSVVISNAYKGDNFAKTTAPTKSFNAENFHQLAGFKLFSKINCPPHLRRVSFFYYMCTSFGTRITKVLQSSIGIDIYFDMLRVADNRSSSKSSSDFNFLKAMNFSLKQDYENAHLMFHTHPAPPKITTSVALNLIGKCDKTAYVGMQPEIRRLVNDFYEENNTFIYAGKARFLEIPSVWHAQESGGYFMKERMSYLGESGIYDFWKGWIERGRERGGSGSRKISLTSNIVVIFFVMICANGLASIAFIMELLIFRGFNSNTITSTIKRL